MRKRGENRCFLMRKEEINAEARRTQRERREFQIGDFRFQKDDGSLKWRAEKLSFEILVSAIILEEIRRSDSIRAW